MSKTAIPHPLGRDAQPRIQTIRVVRAVRRAFPRTVFSFSRAGGVLTCRWHRGPAPMRVWTVVEGALGGNAQIHVTLEQEGTR